MPTVNLDEFIAGQKQKREEITNFWREKGYERTPDGKWVKTQTAEPEPTPGTWGTRGWTQDPSGKWIREPEEKKTKETDILDNFYSRLRSYQTKMPEEEGQFRDWRDMINDQMITEFGGFIEPEDIARQIREFYRTPTERKTGKPLTKFQELERRHNQLTSQMEEAQKESEKYQRLLKMSPIRQLFSKELWQERFRK